jgi:biopolymer transport protein ExbB
LALSLACIGCVNSADAWWNDDWSIRKSITLDGSATGANLTESVASATILLRLSDANLKFPSAQPDGSDIRLVAEDDKTLLSYHIESFDPVLDVAFLWVKIPELKAGQKSQIWMYYGYRGNKATKVEDPKATYDGDTSLVYHFSEHGQAAFDSSGNENSSSATLTPDDGSIIGSGIRLMGHEAAAIPASPSLEVVEGSGFTWSAWIKATELKPLAAIYSRRESGRGIVIGVDNGVPYVEIVDSAGSHKSLPGTPIAPGAWHHFAVVAGSRKISLYLDEDLYTSFEASMPRLAGLAELGGDSGNVGFNGSLDELEISKTARSATAIRLAAYSQGGDTGEKFATYGLDEQQTNWLSGFKTGYVGIIISSLSIDGWVVIGILGVMSAISWVIMVKKAKFVNRVVRGNEQFIEAWKHVATDLSVLDSDDTDDIHSMGGLIDTSTRTAMHGSPLFRIYHIGVEEIRHRLAADQSGASKMLSARSIQAIRASLDGGLVRETQALNRNMVLLTIAISGGPFLGLLGTVVGVMITFAAVAAAGDVNVNAIAPGIAAALAATVAGLGVAIPALFGYNYLLTQIKGATGDIHVFIDEFVTKLAEFYSEPVV